MVWPGRCGCRFGRDVGSAVSGRARQPGVVTHDGAAPLYHQAVELIGRRWTGAIVRSMLGGQVRFTEIRDAVPNISDRLLSERLKELETAGIVERRGFSHRHVEYYLTTKGRELAPIVRAIERWAERWMSPGA